METTIEEIFLTLNLENPKLKSKWQLIHVENSAQTTFGIIAICDCKVLKNKYSIDKIKFRVMNFCGVSLGIDRFVSGNNIGGYDLLLNTLDAAYPIEKEFPVEIVLLQGGKFNLSIETKIQSAQNLKIGFKVCQIEVA